MRAQVLAPFGSFYAVSSYCQPSADINNHLENLDKIRGSLGGVRIVVRMNDNAK